MENYDDDEEFRRPVPGEQFVQFEIRNNKEAPLEENIQTVEFRITVDKPPLNGSDFVALLDVRDYMKGDNFAQMKEATLLLIQQLTPLDRLSIVQFTRDRAEMLCPLRLVKDSSRTELEDLVKGLQTKKDEVHTGKILPEGVVAFSIGSSAFSKCKFRRGMEAQAMIFMSGRQHYRTYTTYPVHSYWFGDGQNAKDWSHAATECLNKLRSVDNIVDQTLSVTEIKDESTIYKVSYNGDPESKMSEKSLGIDGSTNIEIDHNRYNHRILVELLLSETNKKRDADVLVVSYRYRLGRDHFHKPFKINVRRTGEVQVGQLEAPPEVRAEESDDGQILMIDDDHFWRINDGQIVLFPPNSMPCFQKPWSKPIIPGRVQAVLRYNDKVTTGVNEQMVMLEFIGQEKISRSPADIVAVLDVSSNMEGEKLAEMKRAMLFVITKLSLDDRLSIITYSSEAKTLFPLRPVTPRDTTELKNLINGMQACGGADMERALWMGVDALNNRKYIKGRYGAIMLMAGGSKSGHGNAYQVDIGSIYDVPVHTFGFGDDQDMKMLSWIAHRSRGGTYSDVRLGNLCVAFAQCLAGLLTVVAHHLTLFTRDTNRYWIQTTKELGDLCMKECRKVLLDRIPLDESKCDRDILDFSYSYKFDGQEYKSERSIIAVSRVGEISSAEDVVTEEMVLYAYDFVETALRAKVGDISRKEMEGRVREYLAQQLMLGPPEVLAEATSNCIAPRIGSITTWDFDQKKAHATVVECMKIVRYCGKVLERDVELWDDLWLELEELRALIYSSGTYQKEGRAFIYSLESSLEAQRHASRGHNIGRFKLFATPLMRQFLHEAVDFEATYVG